MSKEKREDGCERKSSRREKKEKGLRPNSSACVQKKLTTRKLEKKGSKLHVFRQVPRKRKTVFVKR